MKSSISRSHLCEHEHLPRAELWKRGKERHPDAGAYGVESSCLLLPLWTSVFPSVVMDLWWPEEALGRGMGGRLSLWGSPLLVPALYLPN